MRGTSKNSNCKEMRGTEGVCLILYIFSAQLFLYILYNFLINTHLQKRIKQRLTKLFNIRRHGTWSLAAFVTSLHPTFHWNPLIETACTSASCYFTLQLVCQIIIENKYLIVI